MTNRSLSWTVKVDLADDAERPLLGLARQAKRTEDATERAAKATAKAYAQSSQQVKVSLKGTGTELGQVQIKAKRTGDEFARLTVDEKKAAIASQKLANEHAKLSARSVKLEKDLERAATAARRSNAAQDDGVKKAGRLSTGLGTLIKRAAALGAAYASISGIKSAVTATEDLGKATQGLVNNFGFATDEGSRWAAQAKVRGIDTGKLSVSFNALTKNIAAVTAADKKRNAQIGELGNSEKDQKKRAELTTKSLGAQADAFRKLGIDTKTVKGGAKDFGGFLYEVADGMEAMDSKTERNAVGLKLFGKQWQTLRPLLSGGSDALREQLETADKYGLTLKEADTEGLADMLKAQREWKFALLGVQVQLGKVMMPLLERFAGQLPVIADAVRKHWPEIKKEIAPVVDVVKDVATAGTELVEQHPGLIKVAGAFVAVGLGLKALSFAGQITGVTKLIGTLGKLRGASSAAAASVASVTTAGGVSGPVAAPGRLARTAGRLKTVGKVGAVGAIAGVAGMVASGGDASVGGMVSGALSGAAIGSVAGPWGIAVGAAVGGLSPVIVKKLPEIKAAASRIGKTIGDEVSKVPDWVQKNAPAVATVGRFLGGTLGKAFDGVKVSFGGLKKAITSGIRGDLGGVFGGLKDMAVGGVKTMTAPLREVGERVLNAVKPPLRKAVNWIAGVPGDAADAIRPLPGKVAGAIGGLAGRVGGKIDDAVDAGVSKLHGLVSRGAGAVKGTASKVASGLASLPGTLAGVATRGVTRFVRGLGSLDDRAVEIVKKVPGAIRSAVSGLGDDLAGVGKSIVSGIVSGIKSTPGVVVDAVKSLVPGPLRKVIPGLRRGGEIQVQRRRGGGLIAAAAAGSLMLPAFASGGLVPALVSSGEEIEHGGQSFIVPGPRVAADNVFAMLPERAKVWTEHSQDLRAAGHHVDVHNQVPHFAGGGVVRGKASVFGPPGEPAGRTASGLPSSRAGIALNMVPGTRNGWDNSTTNAWVKRGQKFRVEVAGHAAVLPVIDKGPAASTGRAIDITGAGSRVLGLNPQRFPTDSQATATMVTAGTKVGRAKIKDQRETRDVTVSVPRTLGASTTRARNVASEALSAGLERGSSWTRAQIAAYGNPYLRNVRDQLDEARDTFNRELTLKLQSDRPDAKTARDATKYLPKGLSSSSRLAKMYAAADAIDRKRYQYAWGGGHTKLGVPSVGTITSRGGKRGLGYDCSGAVSSVLGAGGLLSTPLTSGALMSWGVRGSNSKLRVQADAGHTIMRVGSRWFGTSGQNPQGGAGWLKGNTMEGRGVARTWQKLRSGGVIRRFRSGGTTGGFQSAAPAAPKGRSGRAVSAVIRSATDENLSALDQQITSLATSRLDALRQYLAARVDAGGDARTVARVQAALAQVTEQIGFRVGRSAQRISSKLEHASATVDAVGERLAFAGVDPGSVEGYQATIAGNRSAANQARAAQTQAYRDVDTATRNTAGLSPADRKAAIDLANEQLAAAISAVTGFTNAAESSAAALARERPKLDAASRDQVVDLHAAQAQLTATPVDDREAIIERRDEAARQYDEASRRGDIGWMTSSAQGLAQATSDLNAFDQAMVDATRAAAEQARAKVEEGFDFDAAMAALTETTDDDRQVAQRRADDAQQRLDAALARGEEGRADATKAATDLKTWRDALKENTAAMQEQQAATQALTDLMKQSVENQQKMMAGMATSRAALESALAAAVTGSIATGVVRAAGTPGVAGAGSRY